MVRPLLALVLVLASASAATAASELPGKAGMYPQQGAPLAMLDSKVVVRVHGPIAEAVVTQTFRNDTDRVTEATYIFPLPLDAAVTAMEIESGNRTIRASIETRDQAQQRYERAVAEGVGASLLEQERPDIFTQTVSAIPARGKVTVTLRFDTVARYSAGTWELALPLVIAPRYVPGTASGRPTTGSGRAPDTDRAPDASRVTPSGSPGAGGSTEVTLELAEVDDVTSPTHELVKQKGSYQLVDPKSDHDAIIRWRAKAPTAAWVEADDGGGYAAIVVEAKPAAKPATAVKMLLVLDHAATTRGDADAVKKPLVRALLQTLTPKDRVRVAGSDSLDTRAPADAWKALDEAWAKPHGAFDLAKVLARSDDPIVLVTDGLVADDRAVLAAAAKVGAPVHVIGVGPAPNRSLLAAIATTTGGTVRYAVVGDDAQAIARDVLADIATQPEPLTINWGTLAASDVVPATLPRLGANQAMLVLARVKKVQSANARVRGDVFGFTAVTSSKTPDGATTTHGALARRWAKLKLDDLVAAGNAKSITEHALRFGLVSPYTAMVAIGDEVVVQGGVKHSVAVPVSVPAGMQWQHVKREITVDTTKTTQDFSSMKLDEDEKPAKKKPRRESEDVVGGEASGAGSTKDFGDEESDGAPPENAPVSPSSVAMGMDYEEEADDAESIEVRGYRSRTRYSLGLGGGLSIVNGTASPAFELSARVERLGRLRLGGEASLWLVDGLHGQGHFFATIGKALLPRFDLRGGPGLTLTGDGVGPAVNVTLRGRVSRNAAAYLRYDGALLIRSGAYDGQNTGSFGIEASF
ncbi:MAG TPA: VIT domain-containing protein [Kofleriaceae bacterium]|nr:VIT domain-containing protein [Kofleriaceae bacterium]